MSRLVVGPFNRVEGDLELRLDIEAGQVREAWANVPLYRGFEQILAGKVPMDALAITPRICGICSVAQSAAAAGALADAQDIAMPPNGAIAANLILAAENLADHFTHFYLFFMPDFARPIYADAPWYPTINDRFQATAGSAAREVLAARAGLLHLTGLLAGKWPHTLSIQPGGTTCAVAAHERVHLSAILAGFRRFLETKTFGDRLEAIAAIDSMDELRAWMGDRSPHASDFTMFLDVADHLGLERLGRATDRFMSYGAYRQDGGHLFAAGVWDGGVGDLAVEAITEDISHAWMTGAAEPVHPRNGVTLPDAERSQAYTWCKAPRLGGKVVEVGALARQMVDGHPLIQDLVAHSGGNVRNRVIARLLELARVLIAMEHWVRAIRPGAPFCHSGPMPDEAEGVGLVEAARGGLGHWLRIHDGRILTYQIVAPATWNFSPRDRHGVPGALEQALVGAPVLPGERSPIAVQHIVRSFDPCMVCTVH